MDQRKRYLYEDKSLKNHFIYKKNIFENVDGFDGMFRY